MMRCVMCECEMEDAEPYCDDCIEALDAMYELLLEDTDDFART